MKKKHSPIGKTYNLTNKYENLNFRFTTVDFRNLKSFQLEVRFWLEKSPERNTRKEIDNLFRECKRTLYLQSGGFFNIDKIISIQDVPHDLTTSSGKVFCSFEFTLFPTIKFEKDIDIVLQATSLTDRIFTNVFKDKDFITKSRIEKEERTLVQL